MFPVLVLCAPMATSQAEAPLPVVPDGFRVELVQEAPDLLWPSAVHCLADGSLLVAEDPMDMIGPADRPIDRILHYRWKSDGGFERTVFCDELYAVFGMQEIDGAVYVMNMPHLSVLRDADGDGVAEERRELLTDLGPPAPGAPGGFNDHIVSGLRLGMDGWLYVSVGDKGIPRATGTDGSTISLRGGGVVRLRPDGSQLEVFASGTRNHLDVALDERDEIFTYDNTDDGLGWWTRLSHMIEGGDYGYPWIYGRHPERALPTMAEYGGGSPTGGLVYRGGAWPDPYQGSLFFCEWGRSSVRRFELEPAGASFRVTLAEDFMSAVAFEGFRPTDICTSPDGRFLYVADWGIDSWMNATETGRLFRVRRADDTGPPAGITGRFYDSGEGQHRANPNFRARLLAQRELARVAAREGPAEVERLATELLGAAQPLAVRRHAIWLLEELANQRGEAARESAARAVQRLRETTTDASADLRAQAARALGSRRIGTAAELIPLLGDHDATVRRQAANSLARLQDPTAVEALVNALLHEHDRFVRATLRAALRAIPSFTSLLTQLDGAFATTALDLELILRERYDMGLVRALAERTDPERTPSAESRAMAVALLASNEGREEAWDGSWWSIQPAKTEPPAKTVAWEGSANVRAAIRGALDDPAALVRRAALEAIAKTRDDGALPAVHARWEVEEDHGLRLRILDVFGTLRYAEAAPLLKRVVSDPNHGTELRRRAIEVAGAIPAEAMTQLLIDAVRDRSLPTALRVTSLEALGRSGEPALCATIEGQLVEPAPELRAAAARALGAICGAEAGNRLLPLLEDPAALVRGAAAEALAALELREAVLPVLALVEDPATRNAAIDALTRMPDARALGAYLLGLEDREPARREASARALRSLRDDVKSALEGLQLAGELSDKALAQLQVIYSEPLPIARWRILGPIPKGLDCPRVEEGPPAFDTALALGETLFEPREHATSHPAGRIDLAALLSSDPKQVAYGFAELVSPIARDADVIVGSDDQLALWINGELVYDFTDDRAWAPEQARLKVQLVEGVNRFVARIGQGAGAWEFSVAVGRAAEGPLFQGGLATALDVRAYRAFALANAGDPALGRTVYEDETGAACARCHPIQGEGRKIGPDLGDIGLRYGRAELITSVLQPSLKVTDGYRTSWFELDDGSILFAQVQREEDGRVWGVDTGGATIELMLADVVDRGESPLSLMPDGMTTLMSPEEFSDLIAFLESLRGQSAPVPALQDLFLSGSSGYHSFRIPALLATPAGTLLAFCEARRDSLADSGNIDLVLRRSFDGGRTWGELQYVAGDGIHTVGNPCPVYDRETGKILLLATWNKGSDTEARIMAGTSEDTRRVWIFESADEGASWSAPRQITDQVKRPEWRWYATGPGVGVQLTHGRLVIPADHSEHVDGEHPYRAHVFFSDDHGASWQIGGVIGDKLNESQLVERRDGSLWVTIRSYHGEHRRAVATSDDGGETWSEARLDPVLVEPVCQASAIAWRPQEDDGRDWILHANPGAETRERMTLRASPDGGASWPFERVVYAGSAAYSSMVALPDGEVLILFERDAYGRISLARVSPFWSKPAR